MKELKSPEDFKDLIEIKTEKGGYRTYRINLKFTHYLGKKPYIDNIDSLDYRTIRHYYKIFYGHIQDDLYKFYHDHLAPLYGYKHELMQEAFREILKKLELEF